HGRLAVHRHADRHGLLDCMANPPQRVRQLLHRQRQPRVGHPATDVHADRGRDDRPLRRDHRAYGRSDAGMHVGHDGDVMVDDVELRHPLELATGRRIHVIGPDSDGHGGPVDALHDWHGVLLRYTLPGPGIGRPGRPGGRPYHGPDPVEFNASPSPLATARRIAPCTDTANTRCPPASSWWWTSRSSKAGSNAWS